MFLMLQILSYSCSQGKEPDKEPIYKIIGRCFNAVSGVVSFVNHRYKTEQFGNSSTDQVFPLSSHDSTLLNHCRFLSIKITQTQGAGIPVIASLKVIAKPHSLDHIKQPKLTIKEPNSTNVEQTVSSREPDEQFEESDDLTLHSDIPKEFLDPLTCNVMSLPLILPSGYVVDQTSLDRHIEMEKSWGRNASDPFTGVLLTHANQPIINHKLKERIDKYALLNDITVGRTSGRRKRRVDSVYGESSKKINSGSSYMPSYQTFDDTSSKNDFPSTVNRSEDHNNAPGGNLTSRLSKLLGKTSNMRTVAVPTTGNKNCMKCQQIDRSLVYKLSCLHVICRTCLTGLVDDSVIKCLGCLQKTNKAQLVRFHPM